MKFNIIKATLLPLLTRVNSIIEKNSNQKVRTHVLMSAQGDSLELIGFGHEIKTSGHIAADITSDGKTTVSSDKLFDIIRSFPGDADIHFELVDNSLSIVCGSSQFHLATISADDYPLPEKYAFENSFSLPSDQLVELLNRVKFSMAHNDVRHYLNGLLLHFQQDSLLAVTTDGHRLSVAEVANRSGIKAQKIILPSKTVAELISWLANQSDELQVNLSTTHIQFVYGQMEMTSTVINAEYPDYEAVIPELLDELIIVPKDAFVQALKRASILSGDYGLGVSLAFAAWKLDLTARNLDNESVEDSIDINYQGNLIKTAFNIKYLQDILNVISNDKVTISIKDGQSSCLIYDSDKESNRYIVMPMNI